MAKTAAKTDLWKQYLAGGGDKANTAAWQAFQKGGGGSSAGGGKVGGVPKPADYLGNLPNPGDIYNDVLGGLDNFTQTNPDTNSARNWINDMLGNAGMGTNPWSSGLYSDIGNVTPMDEFEWLKQFIGVGGAGGTGGGQKGGGMGGRYVGYGYAPGTGGSFSAHNGAGGGGQVPDTVGPSNSFFAQQIKALFDPARLDPANDPTMQPTLDAMRKENVQDLLASIQDLTAQAENQGAYGSGLYQAMTGRAREQSMESLDGAIAALLHGAREGALGRQMQGLDQTNTRDLAAMQDMTNRYGIDAQAAAASAGAGAAAADAAEARKLQAMSLLLGGKMDILGLRGNMANMTQSGQLGAMNGAMGLGNMGMQGLGMQGDIGGNILGSLLGYQNSQNQYDLGRRGIGVQRGQLDLANRQFQDQVSQGSLNDLLNIIMGIGGMGGTNNQPGQYIPSGPDPFMAALMGGLGGYMNAGGNFGQGGGGGTAQSGGGGGTQGYGSGYLRF